MDETEYAEHNPPPGQKWCKWGSHFVAVTGFHPRWSFNCRPCSADRREAFGGRVTHHEIRGMLPEAQDPHHPDNAKARVKNLEREVHLAEEKLRALIDDLASARRVLEGAHLKGLAVARAKKAERQKEAEARAWAELEEKKLQRRLARVDRKKHA